jgi:hypothetical protein
MKRGVIELAVFFIIAFVFLIFLMSDQEKTANLQHELSFWKDYSSKMQDSYLNCNSEKDSLFNSMNENQAYFDAKLRETEISLYSKRDYYDWERIIWDVAIRKEYEKDIYDCTQFSKDSKKELEKAGYSVTCIYGEYHKGDEWIKHDWLELSIPIDATAGAIIDSSMKENYRIIERGVCR